MDQTRTKDKRNNLIFFGLFSVIIIFRIWLIIGVPKEFVFGPNDDLFYAKAAHYLIHGEWMGPYNQLTLIKAPFYSFFMIFSFLTGLPLFLNETIFYVVACLIFYVALAPLIKNRWWRLMFFTVLLYCPAAFATAWNVRVYREFVYFSLSLFVIAFSIGLFLRIGNKLSSFIFWVVGLGTSMGAFMLTREEGIWIYPMIFLFLITCVITIWKRKYDHKLLRSSIFVSTLILWYIPILLISYLNYSYYGFWGVSENTSKDYTKIFNTLGRIKTSTWYPYSPVTKESLEKAYVVSPSLTELRIPIETIWDDWMKISKSSYDAEPAWYKEKYSQTGGEIGGYFSWLFRDALATSGYYSEGTFPKEFLQKIGNELTAACDNKELDCYPKINIPRLGAIRSQHIPIIFDFIIEDFTRLFSYDASYVRIMELSISSKAYNRDDKAFKYFSEFANNPIDLNSFTDDQNNNISYVGGKNDIRLLMLDYKEIIMRAIKPVYKAMTFPILITLLLGWFALILFSLIKKYKLNIASGFVVFLFILGLLITRIFTLDILRATSTLPGNYTTSCYLFIYILLFLISFYLIDNITQMIQKNPAKN
jgi:hypothetical protein